MAFGLAFQLRMLRVTRWLLLFELVENSAHCLLVLYRNRGDGKGLILKGTRSSTMMIVCTIFRLLCAFFKFRIIFEILIVRLVPLIGHRLISFLLLIGLFGLIQWFLLFEYGLLLRRRAYSWFINCVRRLSLYILAFCSLTLPQLFQALKPVFDELKPWFHYPWFLEAG